MSDLMVLDMGGLALPFDATQAAELTKNMTAGLSGGFKRSARLSMGNSGDWELIDSEGEIHDLGREVNIVIVDQRMCNSRNHYAQSYEEQKESGEFSPPDCYSTEGVCPDDSVENPLALKCADCPANKISSNWDIAQQACGIYRRVIGVLAYDDGTFSDPFVFEPKYLSLADKTIVKERYGSYGWYMNVLASQKRNGVPMPIPTQAVVTKCMPMPKMQNATVKFGIAANSAGGYWTLTKEQFDEILALKDSDEVKDMLKPFNAAFNNPSSAGVIPVKDVTDEPKQETKVAKQDTSTKEDTSEVNGATEDKQVSAPAKKPAPKKAAPAKKTAPKKTVVLGINHPDVQNSEDYDYGELVEWSQDATEEEVNEFLAENFPQALEPVEVDEPAEEPAKKAPPRKVPPKTKKQAVETAGENVVGTNGAAVDPALRAKAEKLADGLEEFDD